MTAINNVTRLLDSKGIVYTAHVLPPEKLGALEAAGIMGVPAEQVFKTIVVTRAPESKIQKQVLAVIPGPASVDLKALAALLGEKKVFLPTERQAEALTGLQAGGISPLALINKGFQVVVDSAATQHERIYISGGQRGLNLELSAADLIELTAAHVGAISRSETGQ
ncbi:MAG TPA: YbaK/EbsC family protein [Anaerolineales bacterium]|jgi:Cys-tRNA(Pro)/Cys-tRNA(Cys) deacylase